MKARLIAPAAVTLALAACDGAIPPFCGGNMIDACYKARDIAAIMSTQLADEAVAEGNAIVAESGAMHNEGRVEMSFRASAMSRNSPTFANVAVRTDATRGASSFGVDAATVTSLAGEVALRVSPGTRVGDTRMLGLDLLGGLRMAPRMDGGSIHTSGGMLGYSYGARLGILQETDRLPAVSLTGMVRELPKFSLTSEPLPTDSGATVSLSLHSGSIETVGWRVAASKRLGRFGLSGGVGRESYYTTVDLDAGPAGSENTGFSANRNTAFIGGSLGIGATTVGVEVGSVFGGDVPAMTNSFGDESPTAARTFVSLGVRLPVGRTRAPK